MIQGKKVSFTRAALVASLSAGLAPSALAQVEVDSATSDLRVVEGATSPSFIFGLINTDDVDAGPRVFNATLTNTNSVTLDFDSAVLPPIQTLSNSIDAFLPFNGSGSLIGRPDLTGVSIGDSRTIDLTITNDGGNPAEGNFTSSATYQVVGNRVLSGVLNGGDLGRHMVGQVIGTFDLSGGTGLTAERSHATDIVVNSGSSSNIFVAGDLLRVQSAAPFGGVGDAFDGVFDSADETHSFEVIQRSVGSYDYVDQSMFLQSSVPLKPSVVTVEAIRGAKIESDIKLNVSGTAVGQRDIWTSNVNLGRFLVDSGTVDIDRTDQLTVVTRRDDFYSATDDTTARLKILATTLGGDANATGVTVDLASDILVNDTTVAQTIGATADFTIDTGDGLGLGTRNNRVGLQVESGEDGGALSGQIVPSSLQSGYFYAIVDHNQVTSEDVTVYAIEGADIDGATLFNNSVNRTFSTYTHTDIGVDKSFTLGTGLNTNGSAFNNAVQIMQVDLTEGSGITAEGAIDVGQVTASTSYNVNLQVIKAKELGLSVNGLAQEDESPVAVDIDDTVSITNALGENGKARATADIGSLRAVGSERIDVFVEGNRAFVESQNNDGSIRQYVSYLGELSAANGQSGDIAAGNELDFTFTFDNTGIDDAADFGTIYSTIYTATFGDAGIGGNQASTSSNSVSGGFAARLPGSTTESVTFEVINVIDKVSDFSETEISAGTDLLGNALTLTSASNSVEFSALQMALLDAEELADSIDLSVGFSTLGELEGGIGSAAGSENLRGDAVEVNGFDGIIHVLQLSYDYDELSGESELDNAVNWYDPGTGQWVNAVLGNSNISNLDLVEEDLTLNAGTEDEQELTIDQYLQSVFFEGSYLAYLLSNDGVPELGAFGVDVETDTAWAVIDHNSTFSPGNNQIPEPSSGLLFAIAGLLLTRRRRRG